MNIIELAEQAGLDWRNLNEIEKFIDLELFAELVAAAERESCAKLCELEADNFNRDIEYEREDASEWCAAAIRARGDKHD